MSGHIEDNQEFQLIASQPQTCAATFLGPFSHSQTNLLVEKRHVVPAEPYSNCKITSTKMVSIVSLNMGVVCYTVIYY